MHLSLEKNPHVLFLFNVVTIVTIVVSCYFASKKELCHFRQK